MSRMVVVGVVGVGVGIGEGDERWGGVDVCFERANWGAFCRFQYPMCCTEILSLSWGFWRVRGVRGSAIRHWRTFEHHI